MLADKKVRAKFYVSLASQKKMHFERAQENNIYIVNYRRCANGAKVFCLLFNQL